MSDLDMNQLMSVIETRVRDRLGILEDTLHAPPQASEERPAPPTPPRAAGPDHRAPTAPLLAQQAPRHIEHRALAASATRADVEARCEEARVYNLHAVSVHPGDVSLAATLLADTTAQVCALIDPLGAATSATRAFAAREAARLGADALDVTLLGGALRDLDYRAVCDDLRDVIAAAAPVPTTVTLGSTDGDAALDARAITTACALARAAGATSVNLRAPLTPDALDAVSLMRAVVGDGVGVKVTTEPDSVEALKALYRAGASCVCAAQGPSLITHWAEQEAAERTSQGSPEPTPHNPTRASGA